ncbi:FAD binding domain-containing protein [Haladaptatus sp. DFWS20]|uniref:FAD binding domain-containing protein n=1 Tax=Haladaptatus sp. DFWS20 TaxID=3403467 RepID=UPI003EBA8E25
MYASEFDYYRPTSVDEAIDLLDEHDGAELLAGGHGILPLLKIGEVTVPVLVDIGNIEGLDGIEEDGNTLTIGALTPHATVAKSDAVGQHATALADATAELGDLQVRNGGTIGGNLAHGDPRADPPASLLALGGSLLARGPEGERTIDADALFRGEFDTDVGDNEVVTAVELPVDEAAVSAYTRHRNPLSGYAMVGVAARIHTDADTVTDVRVAATGATEHTVRLHGVEDALDGVILDEEAIGNAAEDAAEDFDPDDLQSDVQASGEYRAHLLGIYTERTLTRVLERIDAGE